MTDTATGIEIPGYIARAKTVADLARAAADLLEHAADSGLPVPDMARLSTSGQEVSFSFTGRKETFRTLAQWAERFGAEKVAALREVLEQIGAERLGQLPPWESIPTTLPA